MIVSLSRITLISAKYQLQVYHGRIMSAYHMLNMHTEKNYSILSKVVLLFRIVLDFRVFPIKISAKYKFGKQRYKEYYEVRNF